MSSNNLFEPLTEASSSISEESENNCIELIIPKDLDNLSSLSNILIQESTNHKIKEIKENKDIDKDIDKDILIIESEKKLGIKKDNSKNEKNKTEYNLLYKKRRDTNDDTKEERKKEENSSINTFQNNNKVKKYKKKKINDYNDFKKKDDKEYKNEDIEETLCGKSLQNEKSNNFRRRHDRCEGYNIKRKIISHYFKFISGLINIINGFFFKNEKKKKKVKF